MPQGNFAGAQFAEVLIAEVQIGKTLEGGAVALRLAPHNNRRSAELVARQIDALRGQEHNAHGAVNHFLGVAKSLDQIVFAVNQRCDQLGRIPPLISRKEEPLFFKSSSESTFRLLMRPTVVIA